MSVEESENVFIHNVRQRREAKGMSVPELARRSGVPLTVLEKLEQGVLSKRMTVDVVWKLAEIFDCKPHELFR